MPYIEKEKREEIENGRFAENVGELNYIFTRLASDYLGIAPNYARFNDVIGVLESCKLELYRRLVAPYENYKIDTNGDVY